MCTSVNIFSRILLEIIAEDAFQDENFEMKFYFVIFFFFLYAMVLKKLHTFCKDNLWCTDFLNFTCYNDVFLCCAVEVFHI